MFAGFYVANAVHEYVARVLVGMGWVVVEEREEYETLHLVYTSPIGMMTYLTAGSSAPHSTPTERRARTSRAVMSIVAHQGYYVLERRAPDRKARPDHAVLKHRSPRSKLRAEPKRATAGAYFAPAIVSR